MQHKELRVVEGEACVEKVVLTGSVEAVCPVTGMVDLYRVIVEYKPSSAGRVCRYIEALSFHFYLQSYKGRKILQEELTATIVRDFCEALGGGEVKVVTEGYHGPVGMRAEASGRCGGSA
ncbi:GTP cyclohydrolase I [Hyperthermus butylicus]|uniref:GTP cyclohydrolase I n=1 Tax=Hyperthermus butylicus (strain DSM 5456 / JCM 9403 / PLM1-5) TaxID=415426 RepID=A2BLN0_HYPBU|nr:GTP cyclohydrolase I [Hyperthermus butylicus]ABM80891.1 putative GTP cyclohydrolase I [Hyperthermus butylicus DSM 5456]